MARKFTQGKISKIEVIIFDFRLIGNTANTVLSHKRMKCLLGLDLGHDNNTQYLNLQEYPLYFSLYKFATGQSVTPQSISTC